MIKKEKEKIRAIELRKKGFSYNEILRKVPVAKSTLSVWLKEIGIAKPQKQRLTLKRKLAQLKAQETCRQARILRETIIVNAAKKEVDTISKKELWLIGSILYWAEGSKQKSHNVSQRVSFGNSDPSMILLFIRWAKEICKCKSCDFIYSLYIHKTANEKAARLFWENTVQGKLSWTYLKNHNPKSRRKNTKENYHGLLRVDIKKSTDLNRQIKGWVMGIFNNLKI
jgi:hypothetical protein